MAMQQLTIFFLRLLWILVHCCSSCTARSDQGKESCASERSVSREQVLLQSAVSHVRTKSSVLEHSVERKQQQQLPTSSETGGGRYCTDGTTRRRRRDGSMCSCRRRSGRKHLPQDWTCFGDSIHHIRDLADINASGEDSSLNSTVGSSSPCLCVFDIDRTLTGRQEDLQTCPGNQVVSGVEDPAYDGGTLTLSRFAAEGLNKTFCGECFLGVCSAGNAGGDGSRERQHLLEHVLRSAPFDALVAQDAEVTTWSFGNDVRSPLVLSKEDKTKQFAVQDIHAWYLSKGIPISIQRVHFFGDRTENMDPFEQTGLPYNAHEISCSSRDWNWGGSEGMIGYCGATPEEIVNRSGILLCKDKNNDRPESAECYDTPGWHNGMNCRAEGYGDNEGCEVGGWTCKGYFLQGWCRTGGTSMEHANTHGESMRYPERNCCLCGGGFNESL